MVYLILFLGESKNPATLLAGDAGGAESSQLSDCSEVYGLGRPRVGEEASCEVVVGSF